MTVTLDSDLARDLGFDSLGRAELLLRIERTFKVQLSEQLLSEAATPGDLLKAVIEAGSPLTAAVFTETQPIQLEAAETVSQTAQTLTQVLDWHLAAHPKRPHILLSEAGKPVVPITYRDLAERAKLVAAGLCGRGVGPGDRVAIMLPSSAEFFFAFFGALYAGGVPVPIYPPLRPSQIEEHLRRQAGILRNCEAGTLITLSEAGPLALLLRSQARTLRRIVTVAELESTAGPTPTHVDDPAALAMLQYTSGSTGDPKGVMLTHANLLANIWAMGEAMAASSDDVFVSWLPLYHDLGLIGAWLGSLTYAAPVVIMSPLDFLMRPARWLWAMHRHRATLSAAPNFAFELCLSKIEDAALEGLDLSSLRFVANGAEPISPSTIRRFTARFTKFGFKPEAMAPAYGLAECAVGLTMPPLGRVPLIDRIGRRAFTEQGKAVPANAQDKTAVEIVACGRPLPGHEIRIVDATGHEASERRIGRLEFRGPSATPGYFHNATKTKDLFDGEWLDSGDLAYLAGGDAFITGRIKDIIIRAGHNIYPQELEEAIGDIEGIRKNCVAVFPSTDIKSGTEQIVVVAETHHTENAARAALCRQIEEIAMDILGTPLDDVVLAPPDSVPKTSSGKLRRAAARERYEAGQMGMPPSALWLQVARLTLSGLWSQARHAWRASGEFLYAAYWWSIIYLLAGITWPLVILLPKRSWRWALVHRMARLALWLMAIRLRIEGRDNLPATGGVLVANHSSYFDVMILSAVIPGELVFAAKSELAPQFVAGHFLRRLGTLFVERREFGRGVEDTRDAISRARRGERMVFFPEATLMRMPGLLPFRLGAFATAAQSGAPVVPIAVTGTRSILRGDQWFPRHGRVTVHVFEPILPVADDFSESLRLRDRARGILLAGSGEPDLDTGASVP